MHQVLLQDRHSHCHSALMTAVGGSCDHTHFAGDKTEAQRAKVASWSNILGRSQDLQCSLSPYPISVSFTYAELLTDLPARLDGKTSREGRLSVKSDIVFQVPEYSHQKNLWPASDLRHDYIRASK